MTAPQNYLIRHKRMQTYVSEHDVWPTYIVADKALATRYPSHVLAELRRKEIGEDFAGFFEVVEDTDV